MAADYMSARSRTSAGQRAESPASPGGVQGVRASALSNKLSSILSASYADLDIRDALENLDQRKVENTQETRRRLRIDVQKEVIACNGEIIQEFGQVAAQLKRVGAAINQLNTQCAEMRQHINAAHRETAPVLEEAGSFVGQRKEVETKQQLLDAFSRHFTVSDSELSRLTSSAEPVNDDFFAILARVKKIHGDCQVLLGTENQSLGMDILEQSSKNLNGAYQKLYRWIQKEFKTLNLENPQIGSAIRRALRVLAERPTLFQSCLDIFAEAREQVLTESFQSALTGSGQNPDNLEEHPSTKPIEYHAHDPLRYVGDMLAWTHSATVSEREALEVLFVSEGDEIAKGIRAGIKSDPWSRSDADGEEDKTFDPVRALTDLVNRNIIGVGKMLRQRVEQVVQSHEVSTLAFQTASLIKFYQVTFTKLLGEESELLGILGGLEETAHRQFRGTTRDRVAMVRNSPHQAPADLSVPDFLQEALDQVQILMKSYDTSFATTESRESDFESILTEALDPFIGLCENLAEKLDDSERATFSINNLSSTKNVLAPFAFTSQRVAKINESISAHSDKLIEHQHALLLHNSGLQPLIASLAPLTDSADDLKSILSLVQFTPQALTEASQALDDFLPSALIDAMEDLKRLQDTRLARHITEAAAEKFCQDFEFIESKIVAVDDLTRPTDEVDSEQEEDHGLRAVFPRTSGEIRVLLS